MTRFQGQTALVTGSSGMGLASALRLAREGARVHLCGVDEGLNDKARTAAGDLPIAVRRVDLTRDEEVEAWVREAAAADGIDHLVNAAGIQTYGDLDTTTVADWDRVMAVNLRAFFTASHFAWPHLKAKGKGAIVHISSVQGFANQRNVLGYATTKGAVHAMTRAMAVDCAPHGVRVVSISPGSIRTPLLEFGASQLAGPDGDPEEVIAMFGRAHPVGRIGTAEEVANLVAWLCSDEGAFVTGTDVRIDGGLTAQLGV
ncbi:SDR family NAD(P)-dependent oxidoreductase [Rubellimicrobium roseum]|uniref:SDR family oxidoreductase n=1 Tax=Rubellimicrobium roseum TaxID=687525 RepID=A0A5C4NLQ0_9RHOB|nr:SDR family oxidoreductase [Rubellimicrobium roseum]TNC73339.1 SDR family oxidoreductase [Rubellimicrobium roseum]